MKTRKISKELDQTKALHIASRRDQFERNGGGQWVCMNRPHKNKKKYDRKENKKDLREFLKSFLF